MEGLVRRTLKQMIPTHAVIFIIINIIILFVVMIATLIFTARSIIIDNLIRVDYLVYGIFAMLGNLVLIITGVASIYDYKKVISNCIDDIKEADEYCENVIKEVKEAIEEDNETEEDDPCMFCYELCDNCEIFKEKIKEDLNEYRS